MWFKRKPKHEHLWQVDKASIQRFYGGSATTELLVQCQLCGVADKHKIAKVEMTGSQINLYIKLHYNQEMNFAEKPDWSTATPI